MYKIHFYKKSNGKRPIDEYLKEITKNDDKSSRIRKNKLYEYMTVLEEFGLSAGEPYIKNIEGDLWELRPINDRVLFLVWYENSFIMLHHFVKKTRKTPTKEIEQARREIRDIKKGSGTYE